MTVVHHSASRQSSQDSADAIRKRVCKACDRCRLKKSKCDGSHPCSRCKADNAICVFGERKKSHDKVYPKGYVEMLEQQQSQLVAGLQETYKRLLAANLWPGQPLSETSGHPLTHDILARLNLLEAKHDGSDEMETFEEDTIKLQQRLVSEGASYIPRRRGSLSSESEHSQDHHSHKRSGSHGTPVQQQGPQPVFNDNFKFNSSPSPLAQSPIPQPSRNQSLKPSPLHAVTEDDFANPQWNNLAYDPTDMMTPQFAFPSLNMANFDNNFQQSYDVPMPYDVNALQMGLYPGQPPSQQNPTTGFSQQDWPLMQDQLVDADFKQFITADQVVVG